MPSMKQPPPRKLHPVMAERAKMVKEAHAHLTKAVPGFLGIPAKQRMMAVQHHVDTRKGKVY